MNQEKYNNTGVWKLIRELENKKGITEISINSPREVFIEREGKLIQLAYDLTSSDINNFVLDLIEMKNKKYGIDDSPIINGTLYDGSRFNVIKEPFAHGSHAISIRKYLKTINSFHDNPGIFGLYGKWIEFLKACVKSRINVVVAGGTGSGKTTLLNLLLQELPVEDRVVTIEDTLELNFKHKNLVRLESFAAREHKLSIRDLVINSLRMRPDRIIIGEVRGGELFDLLSAMNTGHDGSMSSVHANSAGECLQRMETLFHLAGFDIPTKAIRGQISSGVDLIFQIKRDTEGKRILHEIIEVTGMEGDTILTTKVANFEDGGLHSTGVTPKIIEQLNLKGGLPRDFFN